MGVCSQEGPTGLFWFHFLSGDKNVWNLIEVVVSQHCECTNFTELYTSKCLILCYISFIYFKKHIFENYSEISFLVYQIRKNAKFHNAQSCLNCEKTVSHTHRS